MFHPQVFQTNNPVRAQSFKWSDRLLLLLILLLVNLVKAINYTVGMY